VASILIVDDDWDLAEMLGELLRENGLEVRTAHDGREGLKLVEERLPDLILLDVEMPVLGGPEMSYRMLVHDAGEERVPIVLVSGVPDLFKVAELVGTPYYLRKPYDLDRISTLVSQALVERTPPVPKLSPTGGLTAPRR
jgi:CheY-like chemotaxis protein